MAPQYKLTYFPLRGLGEPIRFILSYMGADFEDNRVEFSDWPQFKAQTPYGKLPYLEFDGKTVTQSTAISRYLGKQAGLAGDNDWESFMIDIAVDIVRDIISDCIGVLRETDPVKKAEREAALKKDVLPPQLERFDRHVEENGGYLANNKLSWGDLYFASVFEFMAEKIALDLTSYKNLDALSNKVFNIPSVKSWIDKRPEDKARP